MSVAWSYACVPAVHRVSSIRAVYVRDTMADPHEAHRDGNTISVAPLLEPLRDLAASASEASVHAGNIHIREGRKRCPEELTAVRATAADEAGR